ncbi:MAG: DUF4097 family beta strand repeat-containing protein [Bacilli bacterium]
MKFYKIMGIIAGVFLLMRIIFIVLGIFLGGSINPKSFKNHNFSLFFNNLYTTEYTKIDNFEKIDIDINMGNIEIVFGKEYAIEYYLYSKNNTYTINDGKLTLSEKSSFGFRFDFFNLENAKVIIYVPKGKEIIDVNLHNNMGNVIIENQIIDTFVASTNMGNIKMKDVQINSIKARANMGNVNISGYIKDTFVRSDMGNIEVTTYYNKNSYNYNINVDMRKTKINDTGGKYLDKVYKMDLYSDMGNCTLTFKD